MNPQTWDYWVKRNAHVILLDCQISFPECCIILHSHYQCMRGPIFLQPWHQNMLSHFWIAVWQVINSSSVKLCKLFIIMRSGIFLYILMSFAYLTLYAVLCYLLYSSCRNCSGEYKNRPFPFCLYLKAQFTDQGLNPHSLDWKRRILTTELPGSPNRPYPWRNLLIQEICPKS